MQSGAESDSRWTAEVESARRRDRARLVDFMARLSLIHVARREPSRDPTANLIDLLAAVDRACVDLRQRVSMRKLVGRLRGRRFPLASAAELRLGRSVWLRRLRGESLSTSEHADLAQLSTEGIRPVEAFAWEILRVLLRGKDPHKWYLRTRRDALRADKWEEVVTTSRAPQPERTSGRSALAVPSGGRSESSIDVADTAAMSVADIANRFGVPREALRKRLERFRRTHVDCVIEASNPAARSPRFLYRVAAVRSVIESLRVR